MLQKDLAITINLQNHTIKIKTTCMIIRAETGKQGKNKEFIKPGKINLHAFNNYFLRTAENTSHNIPTQTSDNNSKYKYYLDSTHGSPFPKIRFNT
jgi:hypothetical protein